MTHRSTAKATESPARAAPAPWRRDRHCGRRAGRARVVAATTRAAFCTAAVATARRSSSVERPALAPPLVFARGRRLRSAGARCRSRDAAGDRIGSSKLDEAPIGSGCPAARIAAAARAADRAESNWVGSIGLSGRKRLASASMRAGLSSSPHSARNAGDAVALAPHFAAHLGEALGLHGRFELDPVDVGRREHEDADDDEIEEAQDHARPRKTSASEGSARQQRLGRRRARRRGSVRSAARSLAERARGLAAISASSGVTGRRVSTRKRRRRRHRQAADAATSAGARLRVARKVLTMRSSSEWNATTTSRPAGLSTRSAAARPRASSPSSSLTKMRSA